MVRSSVREQRLQHITFIMRLRFYKEEMNPTDLIQTDHLLSWTNNNVKILYLKEEIHPVKFNQMWNELTRGSVCPHTAAVSNTGWRDQSCMGHPVGSVGRDSVRPKSLFWFGRFNTWCIPAGRGQRKEDRRSKPVGLCTSGSGSFASPSPPVRCSLGLVTCSGCAVRVEARVQAEEEAASESSGPVIRVQKMFRLLVVIYYRRRWGKKSVRSPVTA